jgi:hypothetical protein
MGPHVNPHHRTPPTTRGTARHLFRGGEAVCAQRQAQARSQVQSLASRLDGPSPGTRSARSWCSPATIAYAPPRWIRLPRALHPATGETEPRRGSSCSLVVRSDTSSRGCGSISQCAPALTPSAAPAIASPGSPAADRVPETAAHGITASAGGSQRQSRRPCGSRAARRAGVGGHRARRRSRPPPQHRRPHRWPVR